MRILGIDPGLATVGIGMIEEVAPGTLRTIDWCTIETSAGLPLWDRLEEIFKDLSGILTDFRPQLTVVEKLFFATNQKTAMDVSHARGAILLCLANRGIQILEPTPMQLKNAITGDGSADKLAMQIMVQRILKLQELPKPDDTADALALAVYGAFMHAKEPLMR